MRFIYISLGFFMVSAAAGASSPKINLKSPSVKIVHGILEVGFEESRVSTPDGKQYRIRLNTKKSQLKMMDIMKGKNPNETYCFDASIIGNISKETNMLGDKYIIVKDIINEMEVNCENTP